MYESIFWKMTHNQPTRKSLYNENFYFILSCFSISRFDPFWSMISQKNPLIWIQRLDFSWIFWPQFLTSIYQSSKVWFFNSNFKTGYFSVRPLFWSFLRSFWKIWNGSWITVVNPWLTVVTARSFSLWNCG